MSPKVHTAVGLSWHGAYLNRARYSRRRCTGIPNRTLGVRTTRCIAGTYRPPDEPDLIDILRAMSTDPPASNAVLDAIEARRSIGRVTPDRPTRAQVEAVLNAAIYAPNHHNTHPWRFAVLAGDARRAAGEFLAASLDRRATRAHAAVDPSVRANESAKFLRAPVVIVVAVEPTEGEPLDEEIAAGAAAVQNMLLAAHSLGLATVWRTGEAVRDPHAAADFGFASQAVIIGFVYLGTPDQNYPPKPRPARPELPTITRWDGWVD